MTSKLFPLIRKIHFFAAAAIALLLAFYTMTAWLMEYDEFFPHRRNTEVVHMTLQRPAPGALDLASAREWAHEIRRELELPGRLSKVERDLDGKWQIDLNSPRNKIRLNIESGAREARLQHTRFGVISTASRVHQLRGSEGSVAHFVWALAVDAVSLILILFSLTGIYLWYVTDRDWLGFILLFVGAAFVACSVAFFV